MSRDKASLLDIFRAGKLVLEFAKGINRADLETDEMRLSAILYQIGIMGEATKRLSGEFRKQNAHIPWIQVSGMRDIIFHQYDRLDLDVVWVVIEHSIPEFLEMITPLIPKKQD